jgi:hypothetical protein
MLHMLRRTAPIFLLLGTAGLLLNEFAFTWGRRATITFAALNVIGLAQLVINYIWMKKIERRDNS